MMGSWWTLWLVFMIVLLVTPLGYGWGYRGWGPPFPRYIQRRRAAATDGAAALSHQSWGWAGDFVWMVVIIGVLLAFNEVWRR